MFEQFDLISKLHQWLSEAKNKKSRECRSIAKSAASSLVFFGDASLIDNGIHGRLEETDRSRVGGCLCFCCALDF